MLLTVASLYMAALRPLSMVTLVRRVNVHRATDWSAMLRWQRQKRNVIKRYEIWKSHNMQ